MTYLIIAAVDANNHPTRINQKETQAEADAIIAKLHANGDTDAFAVDTVHAYKDTKYLVVDMVAQTVALDSSAELEDVRAAKWARIRAQRDALLAASDWRAMPDAPTMSADWTNYRQALRNLPSTEADPDNVVFPEEPS